MIISKKSHNYPVNPIAFSQVKLSDQFWLPRLHVQKRETVPFALQKTEPAAENFRRCGAYLRGEGGELPISHRFISSDLYKVMESAAYLLHLEPDSVLEARMDELIELIGQAQKQDGYLYVPHICKVSNVEEMGEAPYTWVVHSHELYNVGHMYEGAVAYFEATGKRAWLDIAEKSAQHVNQVFFEGDSNYNGGNPVNQAPGHQEPELALCRLYRATGNKLYLDMAKKFLDIRGVTYRPEGKGTMSPSYAQQHAPVAEQDTAVGHAVRAAYMYAAMADVSALTGDDSYTQALEDVWKNIVDKKMHITGGLGAIHGIEGFGENYDLPNLEAYNETCAAIANVFFNHRMTLLHKDAKYFDVAEISLFNNSLAGINLEGNKFFYVNPLEADGKHLFNHGSAGRSPWFDCACCPSNIARIMTHVGGYMYGVEEDAVFILLYSGNSVTIPVGGSDVTIHQQTEYPYDGLVRVEMDLVGVSTFSVKLRIPTWALGQQFVPGDLYSFTEETPPAWSLKVNGEAVNAIVEKGFVAINRTWAAGDVIELDLPMPVRYNTCINDVLANRGRVALTRGPIVLCAEEPDNEGAVQRFFLPELPSEAETVVNRIEDGILSGTPIVSLPVSEIVDGELQKGTAQFIPYASWNNRGNLSMIVWMPKSEEMARAQLANVCSDPATYGVITVSSSAKFSDPDMLKTGLIPESSSDEVDDGWFSNGESGEEWLQMTFNEPQSINRLGVYWARRGSVELPLSWRMEYLLDGEWHPFKKYITDVFGVSADKLNTIHPAEELTCDGLRIHVNCQPNKQIGVLGLELNLI
ncbi:MAG: hypothetical protein CNE95_04930 [Puniceicoccaceae bacterium MED-G30]|jgi:DUF1680 family protein|nr:MAG: hypothetical protein CNE95_04930 [Puniceicoccaceae bacterium MED-G30]|tara:strand:- start:3329 stop:5752 length:2424 start_codon:yes stop_codon:yes gene_type:complete